MTEFSEVVDGILHWKAFHERIRQDAHSYYLPSHRIAIDPMPSEGLAGALAERGGVERVILTNRHHLRGAEELAPGVTAHEVAAICPDDGALHIAIGPGALAFADAVIGLDGDLAFVPDFLMDEPDRVKPETTAALERLLELDFEAILLAHGHPIASGGKEVIRRFIADPKQASFD